MLKNSRYVVLLMAMIVALVAFPSFAQDDEGAAETYDLDGDGVNVELPDVVPFDTNGYVRFAHLAPGVENVDIYVNGELMDGLAGVPYEALGEWMAVEPGGYDIAVTAAGDDIENAVINVPSFPVLLGQWVTVAATLDDSGEPTVATAIEDFSEPLPGTSNVTFLNAISSDTGVTFDRDGIPFVANLGVMFPETNTFSYAIPMDTSTYAFSAGVAVNDDTIATTEEVVDMNEWSSYLVAVYGNEDGDPQLLIDETSRAEAAVLREWLPEDGSILDAMAYIEELEPYVEAFDAAGLVETAEGEGPFTLFIPAGYLADEILVVADGDADLLNQILQAHLYEGEALYSQDLIEADSLTMVNGNEIPVVVEDGAIYVGGAQVIEVNIPAMNGVIHVIGYVIDPTLDQEDYDIFDDAVNLENSADPEVVDDLEDIVDDEEMDDEDMDESEEDMDDEDMDESEEDMDESEEDMDDEDMDDEDSEEDDE